MLRRIKVEDLKEGMIFSEPLFFDDGKNRVLGKGHPVSQRELSVLQQWKVPFVMTAGTSVDAREKKAEPVEELTPLPDEEAATAERTTNAKKKSAGTDKSNEHFTVAGYFNAQRALYRIFGNYPHARYLFG